MTQQGNTPAKTSTSYSNDGSFMQQFMKKYEKPSKKTPVPNETNKKQEKIEEAARLAQDKEQERQHKEQEEMKEEQKKREEMVQKLIADQKKQQQSGPAKQITPKARKQPFHSSKPSVPKKRNQPPPRSKLAMPVAKKQRTSVILPRHKAHSVIPPLEPPKPPPLETKQKIDSFVELVIKQGIELEEKITKSKTAEKQFSFLFNKESNEFKYYEYKKEQLCAEKGIILAHTNLEESASVKALNETVKAFSEKYKDLEKELENDDKTFKSNIDYESIYTEDTRPSDEQEGKFMKTLSSHYSATSSVPDDCGYQSPLISSGNKGAMLLKNMGWTEGTGLGAHNSGRVDPVSVDTMRMNTAGLGAEDNEKQGEEDIFSGYKQLMRHKFRNRPMPFKKH